MRCNPLSNQQIIRGSHNVYLEISAQSNGSKVTATSPYRITKFTCSWPAYFCPCVLHLQIGKKKPIRSQPCPSPSPNTSSAYCPSSKFIQHHWRQQSKCLWHQLQYSLSQISTQHSSSRHSVISKGSKVQITSTQKTSHTQEVFPHGTTWQLT